LGSHPQSRARLHSLVAIIGIGHYPEVCIVTPSKRFADGLETVVGMPQIPDCPNGVLIRCDQGCELGRKQRGIVYQCRQRMVASSPIIDDVGQGLVDLEGSF